MALCVDQKIHSGPAVAWPRCNSKLDAKADLPKVSYSGGMDVDDVLKTLEEF